MFVSRRKSGSLMIPISFFFVLVLLCACCRTGPRSLYSHEASFQRMGGAPRQLGVAATAKCKESAHWKNKEREEFGGFDHEYFYHHTLLAGYNVPSTLI